MAFFRVCFDCCDSILPLEDSVPYLNFSVRSTESYFIYLCKTSICSVMNSFGKVEFLFSFIIDFISAFET